MARSEQVDKLLAEAKDPVSSPERLKELWDTTKSTRVRRAVASNPNADTKTMAMAARLYIKDVIANPSFEILNLFGEDNFVKRIYEGYENPQELYKSLSLSQVKNVNNNRINLARALLVSPNLTSQAILQDICATLSSADFKRELKDDEVKSNVVKVAKDNPGYFRLHCLCFLLVNGVLDVKDFEKGIDGQKSPGSYWSSKGTYIKFVNSRMSDDNYSLLLKWITVNRPGNIRDLIKVVRENDSFRTDSQMQIYADLYRDLLLTDVLRGRERADRNRSSYGWSPYSVLKDEDHSYHLSDLLWTAITLRSGMAKGLETLGLDNLYNEICSVGFNTDFGPYKSELKISSYGSTITGRAVMCEKLLALQDDALEFFVTSGLLWDEWYGRGGPENAETRLVERLNLINERRFKAGETPLYRWSDLDYFPTFKVTSNNGLKYNYLQYKLFGNDNEPKLLLPPGSGRIPIDQLKEIAVRSL